MNAYLCAMDRAESIRPRTVGCKVGMHNRLLLWPGRNRNWALYVVLVIVLVIGKAHFR